MAFMTDTTISTPTSRPACGIDINVMCAHGDHPAWGDARVVGASDTIDDLLAGEILVVDDLRTDMLGFLPICAGVIISSSGPWESSIPGLLHHDFARSGAAALLRALDIPHAWAVEGISDQIATGDLVQLDPSSATIWSLPV